MVSRLGMKQHILIHLFCLFCWPQTLNLEFNMSFLGSTFFKNMWIVKNELYDRTILESAVDDFSFNLKCPNKRLQFPLISGMT
jgi:hypothetical protein